MIIYLDKKCVYEITYLNLSGYLSVREIKIKSIDKKYIVAFDNICNELRTFKKSGIKSIKLLNN
ncbi:hypothetical protein [Candidatus Pelagibacter sp. HIMB1493]|uniref:hypothetical protein n=1 Tax=Candidatus Pelagibacter sp. HIMB1493 TaxID=3413334 RepID=UPI003F8762DE